MTLSLRHIEVFRAVMNAGSVTAAARLLLTSQPTVSRELARMESQLGLRLFDREGNRLSPTAQALMLFEEVERAYVGLERIHRAAESIRRFEQGRLSITCLPIFSQTLLPLACRNFQARHAGVGLSIAAQESPLLEESLSSQRHDLGLVEHEQFPRGTRGEVLLRADMACILPAEHPLAAQDVLQLEHFRGVSFVSLAGLDLYQQQVDAQFQGGGIERQIVMETSNAASVCAMVAQRMGVAIINPLSALDAVGQGLIVRRLGFSIPFSVSLIVPLYRPSSQLTEAFIESLRELAQQVPARLAAALSL